MRLISAGSRDEHQRRVRPGGAQRERLAVARLRAAQQRGRADDPLDGLQRGRRGRAGREHGWKGKWRARSAAAFTCGQAEARPAPRRGARLRGRWLWTTSSARVTRSARSSEDGGLPLSAAARPSATAARRAAPGRARRRRPRPPRRPRRRPARPAATAHVQPSWLGVADRHRRAERARRPAQRRRAAATRPGTARRRAAAWRPSARRRPISERRSSTEITITFAIPTPPTSSATAPRPRNSEVNAVLAAARASSASDGRETSTSSGCSRVGGARRAASRTRSTAVRVGAHVDGRRRCASAPNSDSAASKPISAALSSAGASVTGSRMPTTVNQRSPSQTRDAGVVDARALAAASAPSTTAG